MISPDSAESRNEKPSQLRTYLRAESIVFFKTKDAFGGLSNMAGGYPLQVNGVRIPSSEALYQACRFPHMPDVQKEILTQSSPMIAKRISKRWRDESREDWIRVRVRTMRWCLRVKAAQHSSTFVQLLRSTGEKSIVELSRKDRFWGALENGDGTLIGCNVLGRLLMELRKEASVDISQLDTVGPPPIENFALLGCPIQVVTASGLPADGPQPKLC